MGDEHLTIVFMPESAYGPTNNCIGIGKVLVDRGHRVVFAAEASWKARLEPLGFEEDLVDLAPPPEGEEEQDAGQFWTDFITETAPEFRKPTIEQLSTFIEPVFSSLIDGATYCEPQLREILDRTQPDVIVEDNVNAFPALLTHGAPWVRIMSCNPLEMKDPALPPTFSGYPIDDDGGPVTGGKARAQNRVRYAPAPAPKWPAPGTSTVETGRAGTSPVRVSATAGAGRSAPQRVTVRVVDRATLPLPWRDSVVMSLSTAAGATPGPAV